MFCIGAGVDLFVQSVGGGVAGRCRRRMDERQDSFVARRWVLVVMGSVRLCDGLLKNVLKKCCERENAWVFRIKNLRIFLQVCVDSTCADFNRSQSLSVSEAVSLAAALSVDGLAAGFGAGMMQQNHWLLLALSLGINLLAVKGGWRLGSRFCTRFERDISWSAGLLLILMGCLKWLR